MLFLNMKHPDLGDLIAGFGPVYKYLNLAQICLTSLLAETENLRASYH